MTKTKTLLSTTIATLAIAGMVFMASPAQAGIFNWIGNTPLNQEAQAVKATAQIQRVDSSKVDAQALEVRQRSALGTFFSRIFRGNPSNLTLPDNSNLVIPGGEPAQLSACGPNTAPSITVLSPNGGESYSNTDSLTVKWSSCNISSSATLAVEIVNETDGLMVAFVPNTGIYTFQLSANALENPSTTPSVPVVYGAHFKAHVGTPPATFPSYHDWSDDFFKIIGSQISQCDESDVEVSITGNTPEGIQPISQFDVLEFTIENNSACDILFEDVKVAYMTTDGKPYFDEIQIRDENNVFLGENDELQIDPNFDLGDRITISLNGLNGYEIDAGDHVDLTLRLVNYQQPVFDNTVPYNSYKHKYLMFGFIDEDDFDFKWGNINNSTSFGALYTNNDMWGKRVRIPVSSLGL